MPIQRLEAITFGVEDVPQCTRFFEDFGLEPLERGATGAAFRTPENQLVHLRRSDDGSLPRAIEPGSTLRLTTWGVDSAAGLEALGAELSGDREVRRAADGKLHSTDETGYAVAFCLSEPVKVDVEAPRFNAGDHAARINQPFPVKADQRIA